MHGLWRIVIGSLSMPSPPSLDADNSMLLAYSSKLEAFEVASEKAAGLIYLHLSEEMKVHVQGLKITHRRCGPSWNKLTFPSVLDCVSMPMTTCSPFEKAILSHSQLS
jgi:hypothetical protein